jgi:hypothetical protein
VGGPGHAARGGQPHLRGARVEALWRADPRVFKFIFPGAGRPWRRRAGEFLYIWFQGWRPAVRGFVDIFQILIRTVLFGQPCT